MRQLVITIPSELRAEADVDLEVLVEDWGDEGHPVVKADARSAPGEIWRPVALREEYLR